MARRRARRSYASTSSSEFAKWQLPERIEFIAAIPRTATGKFKKTDLRRQFAREIDS